MPGVFEVESVAPIGQTIDDLIPLAECRHEGEWEGQVRFLPFWPAAPQFRHTAVPTHPLPQSDLSSRGAIRYSVRVGATVDVFA